MTDQDGMKLTSGVDSCAVPAADRGVPERYHAARLRPDQEAGRTPVIFAWPIEFAKKDNSIDECGPAPNAYPKRNPVSRLWGALSGRGTVTYNRPCHIGAIVCCEGGTEAR
jgi:hypothetical protein